MNTLPQLIRDTSFLSRPLLRQGKVRDIYDLGEKLLIVATDRVSAFDVVLPGGIPGKGVILTGISAHWFAQVRHLGPHHLISTEVADLPEDLKPFGDKLLGRFMLVEKCTIFPVECVVRGYLVGSGWKDYLQTGAVCGHHLPAGLQQAQTLPTPLFTPATKAESGHDENITEERARAILGDAVFEEVKRRSHALYRFGHDTLADQGIIMADTKFEFGDHNGEVLLVDEILTPDSSRFWPRESYRVGTSPTSLDKQFIRDFLDGQDWDKTPPGPELPEAVARTTLDKYVDIYRLITGAEPPLAR
jgi:phosphoribosylaminoimidazole-succinocarboxamide synthase